MAFDISTRCLDRIEKRPGNVLSRFFIEGSGFSSDEAYRIGSAQERRRLVAEGAVVTFSTGFSMMTSAFGLHVMFGETSLNLGYASAGIFVGSLIGLIDYTILIQGSIDERGQKALRRAGYKLGEPDSGGLVRLIRIGRGIQAATFGFLGGLVLMVAANRADINAYIDYKFFSANKTIATEAAHRVDGQIARARQALAVLDGDLSDQGRSVQAMRTVLRRASTHVQRNATDTFDARLGKGEETFATKTATRDRQAGELDTLERGRSAAIEADINESPFRIPKRTGFGAKVEALSALENESPRLFFLIIAIELISIALELGPLWVASQKTKSTLAARAAMNDHTELTRLGREAELHLGLYPSELTRTVAPQLVAAGVTRNQSGVKNSTKSPLLSDLNGAKPPKRGVGRPRTKTPAEGSDSHG